MVEKVEAYKSEDGAIFRDEESAKKHEKQKSFEDDIDNWIDKTVFFGCKDMYNMDVDKIMVAILLKDAIMQDHVGLYKILEKYKNYK